MHSPLRSPVLALLLLSPLMPGCANRPATTKSVESGDKEDELVAVRDTLRREARLDNCKTAVAQLNVYLTRSGDSKPVPLTASEREVLTRDVKLTDDELREVSREEFGALDANYLESCLLFHDGVRSLRLNFANTSDLALLERAQLTFAWAMRQVWLQEQPGQPLPPAHALRMGRTSADGRAGIAIEALRQVGLDAALIGQSRDAKTLKAWAIGVPIGSDVYLFDHRSGHPVAGPDGKNTATLKQVRTKPELVRTAVIAMEAGSDVNAVVRASKPWLSPPLPAFAPRMRWLQSVLTTSPPVMLGVDAPVLVERFARAEEVAGWWNPSGDRDTPLRRLATFLPIEEGGTAKAEAGSPRQFDLFRESLVPAERFPAVVKRELNLGEPLNRMVGLFRSRFVELALEPGKPRDQVLRGQFDDASRALTESLAKSSDLQQRIGTEANLEEKALSWVREVRAAEAEYIQIKIGRKGGNVQQAQQRVEMMMKSAEPAVFLIEQAAAEPHAAAVTFQLALCKYEQAERQSRGGSSPAEQREAWETAIGWWGNFLSRFSTASWLPPAQLEHARKLQAQAQANLAAIK